MQKFFLLMLLVVQSMLWSSEASAAPCTTNSLSAYSMLGATGCTIGLVTFSNFELRPPATNAINSLSITVTPVFVGGTIVGVTFGVSPTNSGGSYFDDLIGYRIAGMGSSLGGATVDFAGSSASGDAAASVAETLCLGGTFGADGVSGCSSSNAVNLAVVDVGFGPDPADSQLFSAVTALAVATDIVFDSGSGSVEGSSSTLTSATNLFNVVAAPRPLPEPSVPLLFAAAAFGLALARRRNRSHHGAPD